MNCGIMVRQPYSVIPLRRLGWLCDYRFELHILRGGKEREVDEKRRVRRG